MIKLKIIPFFAGICFFAGLLSACDNSAFKDDDVDQSSVDYTTSVQQHRHAENAKAIVPLDTPAVVRILPTTVDRTAAYFSLRNTSDVDVNLVAIESDIAERIEMHETQLRGDVMRMQKVLSYVIPAKQILRLQPGGKHLMLFSLRRVLKQNEPITLTLTFDNGDVLDIVATAHDNYSDALDGADHDH